jgi:DNA-binding response OmpR family regulator
MKEILLVEDGLVAAAMIRAQLIGTVKVIIAPTLKDAHTLWSPFRYAAIILDMSLPDGNGVQEFLPVVQTTDPTCPVIVYSANDVKIIDGVTLVIRKGERRVLDRIRGVLRT